jgi:Spy/CpxP family protein refolding chaperone
MKMSRAFLTPTEHTPPRRQHMEALMTARNIIVTIAVAAFLAASTSVFAQHGPGGGPTWHDGGMGGDHLGFFERRLPRMAEELGLSEEQLDAIQAIVDTTRPEIESYAEELRDEREAYRATDDDPTVFNEGEFRAHASKQHEIQTNLMVLVGKTKAEVFKVLTPEQIEQIVDMRNNFRKRSHRGGGGRGSRS